MSRVNIRVYEISAGGGKTGVTARVVKMPTGRDCIFFSLGKRCVEERRRALARHGDILIICRIPRSRLMRVESIRGRRDDGLEVSRMSGDLKLKEFCPTKHLRNFYSLQSIVHEFDESMRNYASSRPEIITYRERKTIRKLLAQSNNSSARDTFEQRDNVQNLKRENSPPARHFFFLLFSKHREKSFRLSEYVTSLRQLRDNCKMKFRGRATSRTRDCNYSIFAMTVTKFRRGETRARVCRGGRNK